MLLREKVLKKKKKPSGWVLVGVGVRDDHVLWGEVSRGLEDCLDAGHPERPTDELDRVEVRQRDAALLQRTLEGGEDLGEEGFRGLLEIPAGYDADHGDATLLEHAQG